jgi:hypothetical protein
MIGVRIERPITTNGVTPVGRVVAERETDGEYSISVTRITSNGRIQDTVMLVGLTARDMINIAADLTDVLERGE